MGRSKTNPPAAAPVAQAQPDKSVRRAIGIIARYLAERDQIKPHGPDSAVYRLAEEFKDHAQESD